MKEVEERSNMKYNMSSEGFLLISNIIGTPITYVEAKITTEIPLQYLFYLR